jgi:hypothetical protein
MIPSQVQEQEVTPRLIHSTRVAVVAFLLTGFVAGLTIRDVFFRPAHHHRWLFPCSSLYRDGRSCRSS